MASLKSPVPMISISLAPSYESPTDEPTSPFSWAIVPSGDSFRPQHLTPPPSGVSPMLAKQLSPLRPSDTVGTGRGLERERFEALLKASKERNTSVGAKKAQDLRKEVALKVHKTKQVERRALFLSKVNAPPSPTATSTPKTPPESPAIFHYTLPSPGLVSPLALFESISNCETIDAVSSTKPWVEQVDYSLPADMRAKKQQLSGITVVNPPTRAGKHKRIPSLEEITARLSPQGLPEVTQAPTRPARLPAFLKSAPRQAQVPTVVVTSPVKLRLPIGVGRLKIPVRSQPVVAPQPLKATRMMPPPSPGAPQTPRLTITTTVVPRSSSVSPIQLSELNVCALALDPRARTRRDLLTTLKRRTNVLASDCAIAGSLVDEDNRKGRRVSAPADMENKGHPIFQHPILALPGAF